MDLLSDLHSWLMEADKALLIYMNGAHTSFLDRLMWAISDKWTWAPLYIALIVAVIRKYGMHRGLTCVLAIILMTTIVDQTCAGIIRPLAGRLRPSCPDNPISASLHYVSGYRGGRFGFPSCHAANTWALAVFMSLLYEDRRLTLSMAGWSLLVASSRIYLGVHYPSDILGGMAVGSLVAVTCFRMMKPCPVTFTYPRLARREPRIQDFCEISR